MRTTNAKYLTEIANAVKLVNNSLSPGSYYNERERILYPHYSLNIIYNADTCTERLCTRLNLIVNVVWSSKM